jgi:hypothetical protein
VLSIALGLCAQTPLQAQITAWQLGGGQPWTGRDTVSVMIDFAKIDGAIQPIRIEPGTNIITLLDNWTTFRWSCLQVRGRLSSDLP